VSDAPSDAGFTLTELLVAIVILGMITAPLAAALIGWMRNSDDTYDRLVLSHDAQISAAYFARDVASVGIRDYAPTASDMPFKQSIQVGGASACTPEPVEVQFLSDRWEEIPDGPDADTEPDGWAREMDVVAYYLASPDDAITSLHRVRCSGATVDDVVVAHNVRTEDDLGNKLTVLSCTSSCTAAAVPNEVTLTLTVTRPSGDDYEITLNGQRRQT
jgi:prepilin-type N-terminal cleavage/methylation domain-containing protein